MNVFSRSNLVSQWISIIQHLSKSYSFGLHHSKFSNHSFRNSNYQSHFKQYFTSNSNTNSKQFLYYAMMPISGFTLGSILSDPPLIRADFYSNSPPNNSNNSNNNNNNKNKSNNKNSHYSNKNRRFQRRHARQQFGHELCLAVKSQDYDKVSELLSQPGSDPDARSPYGWSAIHIAVVNNDPKMVQLLIDNGCDINQPDMTSPYVGSIRAVEFSDKIHVNAPTQGWTPLHYAVAFFNENMIKILINNGASPNIVDSRKYTALDYIDEAIPNGTKIIELVDTEYERYLENKEQLEKKRRLEYPIEDQIKENIVGQLLPIHSVSSAVRRKLNGWHDPEHPLVFLFLGSSGVGKTELAKTLAKVMCRIGDGYDASQSKVSSDLKKRFIRIDMSEFQQKHEVSKFIGSPPGYVGHEQGGQLTSRLKECPDAIVLLDEVEKAHPDVLTIMLQLFDEGRITDGKGETIECKDAIFIMTSNLAQTEIADEAEALRKDAIKQQSSKYGFGITMRDDNNDDNNNNGNSNETDNQTNNSNNDSSNNQSIIDETITLSRAFIEDTIQPILKRHFQRDEFLGRINEILYFLPFNESELKKLTEKELYKWKNVAKDRHNIDLLWDSSAVDLLRDGYNMRYGARSIQHEVEKRVINQLAKIHEQGIVKAGMCINISADLDTGLLNLSYFNDVDDARKNGINVNDGGFGGDSKSSKKSSWFGW